MAYASRNRDKTTSQEEKVKGVVNASDDSKDVLTVFRKFAALIDQKS